MIHFSYRSMSFLVPAAYYTGSFFLTVYPLLLILVHPTLNLCMHQFTVDFVITFCASYTTHILVWISLPEAFSSIKNRITLCCSSLGKLSVLFFLSHVIFNWLQQNFTCTLRIHLGTCVPSFDATVLPHVEKSWAMQNFWCTPCRYSC